MMSLRDLPDTEHVYTFVDAITGEPTHIAASTLAAAVKRSALQPVIAEMGGSLVAALEAGTLGVEEDHALKLPESALEEPILVRAWGDTHVIADGAHRLWRRWKRGDKDLICYSIPEEAWRLFIIVDMPGSGEFWDYFNRNAKVR